MSDRPRGPGYALALAAANGDDEEARRRLAGAVAGVPELADEARKDVVLRRLPAG